MAKPKTQLDQAQKSADNIAYVMRRAAMEINKDVILLEEALRTSDGSIDTINRPVLDAILQDAKAFTFAANQERRIVAPTPLGRRR